MTAFRRRALGTRNVASGTIQVQTVAEIIPRLREVTLFVVQVLPVGVIQSTIQLAFLSFAVLRIEVSQKFFAQIVHGFLPRASCAFLNKYTKYTRTITENDHMNVFIEQIQHGVRYSLARHVRYSECSTRSWMLLPFSSFVLSALVLIRCAYERKLNCSQIEISKQKT